MTEVPVAGTTASGRCACTCQYSAIWYGAYRRTTDGSHSKLHRERREYPAGGTNGLRYGRAGRTFRSEYRRTYRHERSRRQYRGQFRNKHLVRTQCLATTRHGRDKGACLAADQQYLATKMREVKVAVKANYQLLLISKKQ